MYWLHTDFHPYCKRQGINLLRDDLRFLETQLCKLPPEARKRAARDYSRKWLQAMAEEGNAATAQNLGRRIANIWLRELVE